MQELAALKDQFRKGTENVLAFANKVRWLMRAQLIVLIVQAVVFTGFLLVLFEFAQKNEQAVEVGCTLLKNAILETGVTPNGQPSDAQKRTAILVAGVMRVLTPAERAKLAELSPQQPQLTIPNCRAIARHPESVKDAAEEAERRTTATTPKPPRP